MMGVIADDRGYCQCRILSMTGIIADVEYHQRQGDWGYCWHWILSISGVIVDVEYRWRWGLLLAMGGLLLMSIIVADIVIYCWHRGLLLRWSYCPCQMLLLTSQIITDNKSNCSHQELLLTSNIQVVGFEIYWSQDLLLKLRGLLLECCRWHWILLLMSRIIHVEMLLMSKIINLEVIT